MSFEDFLKEKYQQEYTEWTKNNIMIVCRKCKHKPISHTIWREDSYDNRAGGYFFGYRCKEESCDCEYGGELKTIKIDLRKQELYQKILNETKEKYYKHIGKKKDE